MRKVCLAAAGLLAAAAHPAAARPAAKKAPASTARRLAAPVPQEVLAEGVCRYTISQAGDPQDEVRFAFRSEELALPRRGAVTPVVVFRDYIPDLPEGAPENERRMYGQEVARFDLTEERAAAGAGGPSRWSRARLAPGLAPGREAEILGLPWISLSSPRAGLTWERTEMSDFPAFRDRFRYRVAGVTTVGGRRAWRVERALADNSKAPHAVRDLQAPARVVQWQETFWVEAASGELLRAERRVKLDTQEAAPVTMSLAVDWARKGARPVAAAEYRARADLFDRLASLERKVQEASARTTLDGASDLRELKQNVDELQERFSQRRYQPAFEKLDAAIERGLQSFRQRENIPQRQGRAAPPFTLPDAAGRPTPLAAFRGRVVLLSFWSAA